MNKSKVLQSRVGKALDYINEATVEIQVPDTDKAIKLMKKVGIKSANQAKLDDEVSVDLKDKVKLKDWLLKNGWNNSDLKDAYPELDENLSEAVDINKIIQDLIDTPASDSNNDQGKFVSLLKGIAFSDDKISDKFMKKLMKMVDDSNFGEFTK